MEAFPYTTAALNRVVRNLLAPATGLLDTFFPTEQAFETEEIWFDVERYAPRISPFVSPLVAGKVVDRSGYDTRMFKPAYVKDKRVYDPNRTPKRVLGEPFAGVYSPAQRNAALLAGDLADQKEMYTRRLEVMAGEVLRTGKITVSGELYPTVVVDFLRDASQTIVLTGGTRWGQAGVSPLANLKTWAAAQQTRCGVYPSVVLMEPNTYDLYFLKDTDVQAELNRQALRQQPTLSTVPQGVPLGGSEPVYQGTFGTFSVWTYQQAYRDDAGSSQNLLPAGQVIMGAPAYVQGVRAHGFIRDFDAGLAAQPYFVKSWREQDPSVQWLLFQSAPMLAPYRPNATTAATVI